MKTLSRISALVLSAAMICVPAASGREGPAPAAPVELSAYVNQPDPSFKWELVEKTTLGDVDYWHIKLTSQTWHDIVWTHDLILIKPQTAPASKKILLINNGGAHNPEKLDRLVIGGTIAKRINTPVAVLLGIPNQPLFGKLREDDLIAETFVRFLDTGDATWPLLFPMVKSLVKAMDVIQEFAEKEWKQPVEKFIVAGASKRGWTTWLTAAADDRVSAMAPMVIDVLNIPEQLPHQQEAFGGPSEQIHPYTERGLVPLPEGERAERLWFMVDPFSYRKKFTMPKLIVLGNNDRYWTTDALNLYWDEIPEPKFISYSPNAGHNLSEIAADGEKKLPWRAIDNVSAFIRLHLEDKLPPKITWTHSDTAEGQLQLDVASETVPKEARLWYAAAPTKDFRDAKWESKAVEVSPEGKIHLTHDKPAEGFYAYYVDLQFPVGDIPLWLCTQLRIAGAK